MSQGVPMILAGDEIGNSQQGNNNTYCQDNAIGWVDWRTRHADRELQKFLTRLIRIRQTQPVLRRPHFLHAAQHSRVANVPDVLWYNRDAKAMTDTDWHDLENPFLALLLPGDASEALDAGGNIDEGDALLILFNLGNELVNFDLQQMPELATSWELLIDTTSDLPEVSEIRHKLIVNADSVVVARCYTPA